MKVAGLPWQTDWFVGWVVIAADKGIVKDAEADVVVVPHKFATVTV